MVDDFKHINKTFKKLLHYNIYKGYFYQINELFMTSIIVPFKLS